MNTVADVISLVRKELNDPLFNSVDTYSFYKDSELIEWINNAQQEFSSYTKCIPDNDSYSISLTGGVREYTYDPTIVEIQAGRMAASGNRLKVDTFENIERRYVMNQPTVVEYGGWESVSGTPRHIVTDVEIDTLVLYPIPETSDTLNLYVFKLSNTVTGTSDTLEIPLQHRYGLTYRVMSQAFNKLDTTNIQDSAKGLEFSQRWQSFLQDAKVFYDRRFKRVK